MPNWTNAILPIASNRVKLYNHKQWGGPDFNPAHSPPSRINVNTLCHQQLEVLIGLQSKWCPEPMMLSFSHKMSNGASNMSGLLAYPALPICSFVTTKSFQNIWANIWLDVPECLEGLRSTEEAFFHGIESRDFSCLEFFSLLLSLWIVLRSNPSNAMQRISQMQLVVKSRARYYKKMFLIAWNASDSSDDWKWFLSDR